MKLYEPFQFLTADECDEIIAYAKRHEIKPGTTLGSGNVRKNRIVWFKDSTNWGKWISMFNSIEPVIDFTVPANSMTGTLTHGPTTGHT